MIHAASCSVDVGTVSYKAKVCAVHFATNEANFELVSFVYYKLEAKVGALTQEIKVSVVSYEGHVQKIDANDIMMLKTNSNNQLILAR